MVNYEFLPQPANSKVLISQLILHSVLCHLTKILAPAQPAKVLPAETN